MIDSPATTAMIGSVYNMLTVIDRAPDKNNRPMVHVRCACGNTKIMNASNVRQGSSSSCGCANKAIKANKFKAVDTSPWVDDTIFDGQPFQYGGRVYRLEDLSASTALPLNHNQLNNNP